MASEKLVKINDGYIPKNIYQSFKTANPNNTGKCCFGKNGATQNPQNPFLHDNSSIPCCPPLITDPTGIVRVTDGVSILAGTGLLGGGEVLFGGSTELRIDTSYVNALISASSGGSGAITPSSVTTSLLTVISGSSGVVPSIIRGASSQSANLTEWQNNSSTVLALVNSLGGMAVGGPTIGTTFGGVDIWSGGLGLLIGADDSASTRTNSTTKNARAGLPHYTNSEEPVGICFATSTSSANEITVGGGSSVFNAATAIKFNTAANNTTTDGTTRLTIDSTGNVLVNGFTSSTVGLTVKAAASQSANLTEWKNSSDTTVVSLDAAGRVLAFSAAAFMVGSGNTSGQTTTTGPAFAIGTGNTITGNVAAAARVCIGTGNSVTAAGTTQVAVGVSNAVSNTAGSGFCFGIGNSLSGQGGAAIGLNNIVNATGGGYAFGNGCNVTGARGVGFGTSTVVSRNGVVAYCTPDYDPIFNLQRLSSTTVRDLFDLTASWATSTDASRKALVTFGVYDTAARECLRMEADGTYGLTSIGGAVTTASTALTVTSPVSTFKSLVVKGATSQSANLQEWQNSSGTALTSITAGGNIISETDGGRTIGLNDAGTLKRFSVNAYGIYVDKSGTPTPGYIMLGSTTGLVQIASVATVGVRFGSTMGVNWATDPSAAAPDVGIYRNAAGVLEINSSTAGQYRALVLGADTATTLTSVCNTSTSTANIDQIMMRRTCSTSIGSGFGTRFGVQLDSNGSTNRDAGGWSVVWGDATDATRTGSLAFYAYYTSAPQTGFTVQATSGGHALVSVGNTTLSATRLYIPTGLAANKGLVVRGSSSQSANLTEWQDSTGAILTAIDNAGRYYHGDNSVAVGTDYFLIRPAASASGAISTSSTSGYAEWRMTGSTIGKNVLTRVYSPSASGTLFGVAVADTAFYGSNNVPIYLGTFDAFSLVLCSNNTPRVTINSSGNMLVNGFTSSTVGVTVKGAASQSANLQEWQDSTGAVIGSVSSSGSITAGATTATIQSGNGTLTLKAGGSFPKQIDLVEGTASSPGLRLASDKVTINRLENRDLRWDINGTSGLQFANNFGFAWTTATTYSGGSIDLGLNRSAAGVLEINNGTVGQYRALIVGAASAAGIALTTKAAASQTANIQEWQDSSSAVLSTISENGYFTTRKIAAPADGELAASEVAFWFDSSNGASRLKIKGKSADGTVVTGEVTLA